MARVKAEFFETKDKATGEVKEVQFIPPAPSGGDLGGISKEKLEQIDKLKEDIVDLQNIGGVIYSDNLLDLSKIQFGTYRVDYGNSATINSTIENEKYDAMPIIQIQKGKMYAFYTKKKNSDDCSILASSNFLVYDDTGKYVKKIDSVNGIISIDGNYKYASSNFQHHDAYDDEHGTVFVLKEYPPRDKKYMPFGTYKYDVAKASDLKTLEDTVYKSGVINSKTYFSDNVYNSFFRELYIYNPTNEILYLKSVLRKFSSNNYWRIAFYNSNGVEVARFNDTNESSVFEICTATERNSSRISAYMVLDWSLLEEGKNYELNLEVKEDAYNLNLCNIIKSEYPVLKNNFKVNDLLDTIGRNTPIFTWIDDDTASDNAIESVKEICDSLGIKATFACVTNQIINNETRRNLLLEYQKQGFHVCSHSTSHASAWSPISVEDAEKETIESIMILNENGFLEPNFIVTPFGANSAELMNRLKNWCEASVLTTEGVNHLAQNDQFHLKRIFIKSSNTLEYYKNYIDKAYQNGDWIIFGTHSNTPSEFDKQLVTNVLQYAIDKGMKNQTLIGAWKIRKPIYILSEMFN